VAEKRINQPAVLIHLNFFPRLFVFSTKWGVYMALSPDFTARKSRNYHRQVEQELIIKTKADDDLTIPINKKGEKTIRLMFQLFKMVDSSILLPNTYPLDSDLSGR